MLLLFSICYVFSFCFFDHFFTCLFGGSLCEGPKNDKLRHKSTSPYISLIKKNQLTHISTTDNSSSNHKNVMKRNQLHWERERERV